MDTTAPWTDAVAAATLAMSSQGARERRRHARDFSAWCSMLGIDPATATRDVLQRYLESLPNQGAQQRSKTLCSLRAVLRHLGTATAALAAGLGNQAQLLARHEATPSGELIACFLSSKRGRRPVRKAAVGRLLAWCSEVGLELTDVFIGDLAQFGEWLREVRAFHRETLGVAKGLILLRHSSQGRSILGEPEAGRPCLQIEMAPPMHPRFDMPSLYELDRGMSVKSDTAPGNEGYPYFPESQPRPEIKSRWALSIKE